MKRKWCYVLWGGLYSLCAACGFIPEPEGALKGLLTALAVVCFVPPAVLLFQADRDGDRDTLKLVRNLSLGSLGLTVLTLSLNLAFAPGSRKLGTVLHGILVIVSSPMVCSGYWALSLFLWACLLMTAIKLLRKKK